MRRRPRALLFLCAAAACVVLLAIMNLRGIRESGLTFALPTYIFMAAILGMDHREIVTDDLGKVDAKVPELIQLKDNVIRA